MAPLIEVSDDFMKILPTDKYIRRFDLEENLSNSYSANQNKEEKYLKGKTGKIFNRVEATPENSFFKKFDEYNDTAKFDFCGNESEAIAKRIFSDDICNIISGSYQTANYVKTEPGSGRIKRTDDGWEVTERLNVFLED